MAFALLSLACLPAPCRSQALLPAQKQAPFLKVSPDDEATEQGFLHFYSLEYDAAIRDFELSLARHPSDPFAVNHLLEAVLFAELHREGKLDAQLYMSNEFVEMRKVEPDARAIARADMLMARAASLEQEELERNPNDVRALYARSVTRGLRAADQALVGKQWFAALRSGLAAYDDSKRVLELDPGNSDAKLIVGVYNYVVGSLSWPVRVAALLAAIHGNRSKGLLLMREAAEGGGEASVDARTTLALFLARERRYRQALALADWLSAAFPRNFIFALSQAGLLKDTGDIPRAVETYRRLIQLGSEGRFPHEVVGLAALNLGRLLRSEEKWDAAARAYDQVERLPNSTPDLVAMARLAAGEMYDRAGDRASAVERYREVVAARGDAPDLAAQAGKFLQRPYAGK